MSRERLSSRLGFLMLAAGCAIGLGNIWRFPWMVGQYGGATFILMYLVFVALLGVPIMTMEFTVGRAAGFSAAKAFNALQPGSKWRHWSKAAVTGNYLLMWFYTGVTGWMVAYLVKNIRGDLVGLDPAHVGAAFNAHLASPGTLLGWMVIVCAVGYTICAGGLVASVERMGKFFMFGLFIFVAVLAVRAISLPGAGEGLAFYLRPNLDGIRQHGFGTVAFAAMGQAFFSLSLGIGSMTIFGSYIGKDRTLFGEAVIVSSVDSFAAIMAGLVIFPACFAYGVNPGAGPGLIFVALPNVFNNMPGGQFWGTLFFVFMVFAAMSTVIAVYEAHNAFLMEVFNFSRKKASITNFFIVSIMSIPASLGFNLWSSFQPLGPGSNVQGLIDFILSMNLLPIGGLVYCLFCVHRMGWGWDKFTVEADTGSGLKVPAALKVHATYIVPVLIIIVFVMGYYNRFFR
jgi:NSS family neurotransmitter:Na+ symporter